MKTGTDQHMPFLRISSFEKRFGNIHAVKPSDLNLSKGESLALLGPNGGGKSTIIRAVVGAIHPTSGSIEIAGMNVRNQVDKIKQILSYLPQRIDFPGMLTARELLFMSAELRGCKAERVEEMIDFFSLQDAADRRVQEYSGGMIQRLALSICFLPEVQFYVLDEPTLNLDPLGTEQFRKLVGQLKERGATILFTSHIIKDALQLADRVAIVSNGEIAKIESVPDFYEAVQNETEVHLVLQQTTEELISAACAAGARLTDRNGHRLSFRAHPEQRLHVIKAIEAAGGHIEEFRTVNPDWDSLLSDQFTSKEDLERT
jgi:ABC-type multidrug transport system ATPase subunit